MNVIFPKNAHILFVHTCIRIHVKMDFRNTCLFYIEKNNYLLTGNKVQLSFTDMIIFRAKRERERERDNNWRVQR